MNEPKIVKMPIAQLRPAPYNPRRISEEARAGLRASIERFGLVQAIIWNQRSGNVVGGHQRLDALVELGETETHVYIVDLNEADEKALNIALNNRHIAGEFDEAALADLLNELQQVDEHFEDLRFDVLLSEALESLGANNEEQSKDDAYEGETDPDDTPEEDETDERVSVGDIWQLGNHRLLCGDATTDAIKLLLGRETVDSLVTDPPYGVDYGNETENFSEFQKNSGHFKARLEKHADIRNDAVQSYRPWFAGWLRKIPFAEYSTLFIFTSSLELHNLRLAFDDCKFKFSDYLVWVKNTQVMSRKDYHGKVEFIVYGWAKKHKFYSAPGARTTALEYDRPTKSDLHPTMKPAALIEQLVRDGSPSEGIVLDPFGGSGTTLIACQEAGRHARIVEIEPRYCDATLQRWESFTGQRAELVSRR